VTKVELSNEKSLWFCEKNISQAMKKVEMIENGSKMHKFLK
jgi:hypothetical protein